MQQQYAGMPDYQIPKSINTATARPYTFQGELLSKYKSYNFMNATLGKPSTFLMTPMQEYARRKHKPVEIGPRRPEVNYPPRPETYVGITAPVSAPAQLGGSRSSYFRENR